MPISILTIEKNWYKKTEIREINWDEIKDKTDLWSVDMKKNLEQIGTDLFGSSYDFFNTAVATSFKGSPYLKNITLSGITINDSPIGERISGPGDFTTLSFNSAQTRYYSLHSSDFVMEQAALYLSNWDYDLSGGTYRIQNASNTTQQVGNDLNIAGVDFSALAALNSTDVAFIDSTNDDLRTYRFDGTDWSQVGNDLSIAGVGYPALAALNSTDVAFIDRDINDLRTYRFDGTDWSQVGNDLTIAGIGPPALAALNSTDVAFIDRDNDDLRTYRFDGTDWSQVGNDLSIAGVGVPALAALNSTDVAFIDSDNDDLRTYRFDGTDWSQVGNDLSIAGVGYPALAALNGTDVAFIDRDNDDLRTYRFDGTDWSQVGNDLNIAGAGGAALAALNSTDVAFIDETNEDLRTYRFKLSSFFIAPIQLPHGAIVTDVTVYFARDDAASIFTFDLKRTSIPANADSTMASITASDTTGNRVSENDNTISNATIDNENYTYYAKIHINNNDSVNDIIFYGAKIEYTISKAEF